MADYGFNTNLGPQAQQATSLGDMIKLAGGIQAYQQAQEVNPYLAKKAKEEASQAEVGTKEKQLGFTDKQQQLIFDELGTLKIDPRWQNAAKDKMGAAEALMEREDRLKAKGIDPTLLRMSAAPFYDLIEKKPQLAAQVVENIIQRGGNERQFSQLNQAPQFVNTGAGIVPVFTSPFQGGGAGKNQTLTQSLPPTVATSETGAPMIIGGGRGAGVQQQGVTEPVTPAGKQNAAQSVASSFESKGGLQRAPDETYDAYKARTGRLAGLPTQANALLNQSNPESVPNMMNTNKKVLRLLDKGIDVGPIADAIAGTTKNISLSEDQQTIRKYLEQRIRQEAARSNQDQASQKAAYGSFGTDANALRSIIYTDNGRLVAQNLYLNGIKNHQGNPNKPNLSSINNFENEFTRLAQDPNVTHLMGVIGDKAINELSKHEIRHLQSEFGDLSAKQLQNLLDKRDELVKLSNGK